MHIGFSSIFLLSSSDVQIVCNNQEATIDCGERYINMISAIWGRTDDSTCGSDATTNCTLDVISYMIPLCDNQKSCTFKARNGIFGRQDPCLDVVKYLNITHTCEGNTLHF